MEKRRISLSRTKGYQGANLPTLTPYGAYPAKYSQIEAIHEDLDNMDNEIENALTSTSSKVRQVNHGFTLLNSVYFNTTTSLWTKAQADNRDTVGTHVIVEVIDKDNFIAGLVGEFEVTNTLALGYWFTSATIAGELVDVIPDINNPMIQVLSNSTIRLLNLGIIEQEPEVIAPVTPDYTAITVGDTLQDVAEKVAGIGDIPKRIDFKSKIDNLSLTRRVRYAIPSEFKWQDSPINSSIYFDDLGNAYVLGFDASSYKITGTTYYVATTGNDLNDGSQATPFLTIQKALDQVDVDCVIVESGTYQIADTLTLKRDCSIIGEENVHIEMLTSHTDWTLTSGRINTWRRNIVSSVNATGVYEKFYNFEDYTKYVALGSINLVEATPGSYIAGSYLYVHALNSLKPSENVFVANGKRCIRNDGFSMYLENIKITGGWYVVFAELGGTIVAKDCIFMYSGRNCVNVDSTGLTIMQNCIAANSYYDGFNYHNYTGDTKVIEINCESYNNGRVGDSANQGSTAHNGIAIIRINGKYHNNLGSGIADINTDTHSLNINCSSFLSKASSIPTYSAAFAALTSAKLWVINSIGFSNTYGILAQTGATVYTSNNVISGDNVIEGTGTIVSI